MHPKNVMTQMKEMCLSREESSICKDKGPPERARWAQELLVSPEAAGMIARSPERNNRCSRSS